MPFGLTWQNWVGFTLETGDNIAYKATGTAGTGETSPTVFLPLAGAESIKRNPNTMFSPSIESLLHPMRTSKGAEIVTGSLPVAIPVGLFSGSFITWAIGTSGAFSFAGDAYQLPTATLWVSVVNQSDGNRYSKKVTGVKISKVTIESAAGSNWVNMTLDIVGRDMILDTSNITLDTILTSIYGSAALATVPEYRHLDSRFYSGAATGAWLPSAAPNPATNYDVNALAWTIVIDNKVSEDGFRLDGEGKLRRAYNTGREITGTFSKDFRSVVDFNYFLAQTDCRVGHWLYRDAGVSLAFDIPRCAYNEGDLNNEGDKEAYNKNNYGWRALSIASPTSPYVVGDALGIYVNNSLVYHGV
jgi:hypothetical protein